jgi:hypothetical protein
LPVLGRGLNPSRFVALLEEFRHKLTQERINARLTEVKQEELIALIKLQAELRARYLVTVLDLIDPNLTDITGRMAEARHYREMAEEIEKGVKAIVDGVLAKEIPMSGLDHGPEYSPEMEHAIAEFIAQSSTEWDLLK